VREQSEVLEDQTDFPTFRRDVYGLGFYRPPIDLNASLKWTIKTCD
jgi:hypothetical protein